MKKLLMCMMVPVLLLGLAACRAQEKSAVMNGNVLVGDAGSGTDIRKLVYDQMDSKDRDRMREGWEEATVVSIVLTKGMAALSDPAFIGKEVFLVDFKVKTMSIPDNMVFYASKSDGRIIGIGLVD